jgi:hypothetical protein
LDCIFFYVAFPEQNFEILSKIKREARQKNKYLRSRCPISNVRNFIKKNTPYFETQSSARTCIVANCEARRLDPSAGTAYQNKKLR